MGILVDENQDDQRVLEKYMSCLSVDDGMLSTLPVFSSKYALGPHGCMRAM